MGLDGSRVPARAAAQDDGRNQESKQRAGDRVHEWVAEGPNTTGAGIEPAAQNPSGDCSGNGAEHTPGDGGAEGYATEEEPAGSGGGDRADDSAEAAGEGKRVQVARPKEPLTDEEAKAKSHHAREGAEDGARHREAQCYRDDAKGSTHGTRLDLEMSLLGSGTTSLTFGKRGTRSLKGLEHPHVLTATRA